MLVTTLKEGFMTYALTYRTWYYNEVVLYMVSVWKFFCFTSSLFDIVVIVSGELQFIFAQVITEIIVSCANT
jgi:hypothetical protein